MEYTPCDFSFTAQKVFRLIEDLDNTKATGLDITVADLKDFISNLDEVI